MAVGYRGHYNWRQYVFKFILLGLLWFNVTGFSNHRISSPDSLVDTFINKTLDTRLYSTSRISRPKNFGSKFDSSVIMDNNEMDTDDDEDHYLPSLTSVPTSMPTSIADKLSEKPDFSSYSYILSMKVSFERFSEGNSALIFVNTSQRCTCHCAAFSSGDNPISIGSILSQSFLAITVGLSAAVPIAGLVPSTAYRFMCTTSYQGRVLPLSYSINYSIDAVSPCCKKAFILSFAYHVPIHTVASNSFALVYDYPPSLEMTSTISWYNKSLQASVSPPHYILLNSSVGFPLIRWFSFLAYSLGEYKFSLVLSGPSASEYEVVYVSNSIQVVQSLSGFAPTLLRAHFSNEGGYLIAVFDNPTDRGGKSTFMFTCSDLFEFESADNAICNWISSSMIEIFPGCNKPLALRVGSLLSVIPGRISGRCDSYGCLPAYIMSNQTVEVGLPRFPIPVTVVITSSSSVSSCGRLLVDISGSHGSGGQSWEIINFDVESSNSTLEENLEDYLNLAFSSSLVNVIPTEFLLVGDIVSLTVTMCNFLGSCGYGLHTFEVLSNTSSPFITIAGSAVRSMVIGDTLVLNSVAYSTLCDGSRVYDGISYFWNVFLDEKPIYYLQSESKDPSVFRLPPYSLLAGKLYEIRLMTLNPSIDLGLNSSLSVYVTTMHSSIVPVIQGPLSRQIYFGDTETIDASKSHDPENPMFSALLFSWKCSQLAPILNSSCPLTLLTSTNVAAIKILASDASINTTAMLTLYVSTNDASRTGSIDVKVSVMDGSSALVSIASLSNIKEVNYDSTITFVGSVFTPKSCEAVWGVQDTSLNMSMISRSPLRIKIASHVLTTLSIVISRFVLPERNLLSFYLSCGDSTSMVSLSVNGPPLPGRFDIFPMSGMETATIFTFIASLWTDKDLPLTYFFGFNSTAIMTLQAPSESTFLETYLPSPTYGNGTLMCLLYVYDSLGSFGVTKRFVTITRNPKTINANLSTFVVNHLSKVRDNMIALRPSVSVLSTVVNGIDCSASPSCDALHRYQCSTRSNTCGSCLVGYIGDFGSANTPCFSIDSVNETCYSDSDCSDWQLCQDSICMFLNKSCGDSCGRNGGTCDFINSYSHVAVDSCFIGDSSCETICTCLPGRFGADCSLNSVNVFDKILSRDSLIQSTLRISDFEDTSLSSLFTLSANIASSLVHSNEISDVTAHLAVSTISSMLNISRSVAPGSSLYNVYGNLATALDTLLFSQTFTSLRRKLFSNSTFMVSLGYEKSLILDTVLDLILVLGESYGEFIAADAPEATFLFNHYRLVTGTYFLSDSTLPISVVSPLTPLESFNNVFPLMMTLSSVNMSTTAGLSLLSVQASLLQPILPTTVISNPFILSMNALFGSMGYINATFDVPHFSSVDFTEMSDDYVFESVCYDGYESFSTICPVSQILVEHNCNGAVGLMTTRCPSVFTRPYCASFNSTNNFVDGCSLDEFDGDHSVFSCVLNTNSSSFASRRDAPLVVVSKQFVGEWFTTLDPIDSSFLLFSTLSTTVAIIIFVFVAASWCLAWCIVFFSSQLKALFHSHKSNTVDPMNNRSINSLLSRSIPHVFRSTSLLHRLIDESLYNHRYVAQSFFKYGFSTAILRLGTVQMILLCVLVVEFDIFMPKDVEFCENNVDMASCNGRVSSMSNLIKLCHWNESTHSCSHSSFPQNWRLLVLLSFSSVLVASFCSYILNILFHMIEAPFEGIKARIKDDKEENDIVPFDQQLTDSHVQLQSSMSQFEELVSDIRCQRKFLRERDLAEFDYRWGIDNAGEYSVFAPVKLTTFSIGSSDPLFASVRDTVVNSMNEVSLLRKDINRLDKRLTHLLIMDVLGPKSSSALIFGAMCQKDTPIYWFQRWAPKTMRALSLSFVLMGNVGCVLVAVVRGQYCMHDWQSWGSFAFCIAGVNILEIIVLETLASSWVHFILPSVAVKNVRSVIAMLQSKFTANSEGSTSSSDWHSILNVPKYLFVSYHVAKILPFSSLTQSILSYEAPFPNYLHPNAGENVLLRGIGSIYSWISLPVLKTIVRVAIISVALSVILYMKSAVGTIALLVVIFVLIPVLFVIFLNIISNSSQRQGSVAPVKEPPSPLSSSRSFSRSNSFRGYVGVGPE